MIRTAIALLTVLTAGSAIGAEMKPLSAPAPDALPALTRNVAVRESDSALVKAAKNAAAQRLSGTAAVSMNELMVKGGAARITFGTSTGNAAQPAASTNYNSASSAPLRERAPQYTPIATVDREALKQQKSKLETEQKIMASEAEEPYGGDISEDTVAQRQSQIPQQVDQINQQLQPQPSPSKH